MSPRGQDGAGIRPIGPAASDAERPSPAPPGCEDYGYGLGRPTGIRVLVYRGGPVEFPTARDDVVHQLYWSPDGVLSALHGADAQFVGPTEGLWVHRGVRHEVRAADRQTLYRVLLRELPPALGGLRAGVVAVPAEAGALIQALGRPGCAEPAARTARAAVMAALRPAQEPADGPCGGAGFARAIARELSRDPGSPTSLDQWAERLHVSTKTLQRDFRREFGTSYTRWRTTLRLRAARVMLQAQAQPVGVVAQRVGYASASAFIAAFGREYGHTPGGRGRRADASQTIPA
ncbi:helix-turn-helix transcriptional regulator [Pseudonocardia lacus]|uniref:helix-turn-helix transcriptional regulator n=1 Tax=Pseudonocardia lacus TaxID=2835865 RepID=UPI001BDBBC1F|nr:AraC family transcriptional regulator [Pseudonocardia lacus]